MNGGIFLWRGLTYEILGVAGGRGSHWWRTCANLAKKLGSAIKTQSHLFPIQTYLTSNVQKKTLSAIDILET